MSHMKFIFVLLILMQPVWSLALDNEPPEEPMASGFISHTEADSLANKTSTVLLPVLGYTPDTGLMLGGTVLRFFYLEPEYADSRPSVFSPVFIYSLKNQVMIFLGTHFSWDENRYALDIVPGYIKFPDLFYGIGRQVSLDDEEKFTSENLELFTEFNRTLWGNWRLGLSSQLTKHRLVEVAPGGQFDHGKITGSKNSWLSGLGPALILDSRDNTWSPHQGWFLQANARFGGSSLGSDFTYEEYTLDLRGYRTIAPNLVLAGQYLTTSLEGDAPFYILPRLGGNSGLRGYRGGLYMDKTRALARVELRRSKLWKSLGMVAFAGIGDVAPAPSKLTLAGNLWSAGLGFRFMVDSRERVNLRVDFGFGNDDSGFYISLGEAF